ncbi:tol-pal system protein YbgF [Desulfobacterales bacterium HSG2]|nr:tol-pal system protein YbgF [Desulfobacterales bacterium HSG2]
MKFIILIASACLCGCAMQQDMLALNERIIALEERNSELEQRGAASMRESERIRTRIEDYSKTHEEKTRNLRSQSAEMQALFEGFREEVQGLRGKLEETDYLLRRKISTLEEAENNRENRLRQMEQQLNSLASRKTDARPLRQDRVPDRPEAFYPPTEPRRPAFEAPDRRVPKTPAVSEGLSENELYALAKQAFDRSDFQIAQEGFRKLINIYPESRRADNAQFWIGEISYRQKRYEDAILEYQTVIEKYPKGNKVKAALLKQGFAFFNLGDKANARLILQELVDRYPDSHEAKLARDKLDWF